MTGLGTRCSLLVSMASRYGFGMCGCCVDSCGMRNFCSDWVLLGSLGVLLFSALAMVAFRFVSLCVFDVSCL